MNFKIIDLEKYESEVCLHRGRDEEGNEIVSLTSFIFDENEEEFIIETVMPFPSGEMAQDFIQDYSVESAVNWLVAESGKQGVQLQP